MLSDKKISFAALEELNGCQNNLAEIFTLYISLGLRVIPLDPKERMPADWTAIDDPEKAAIVAQSHPDAAPGILTGDGLVAIECHGGEAKMKIDAVCKSLGISLATTCITSVAGDTYLFSSEEKISTETISLTAGGEIVICGEGGFTLAAPAKDADGRLYEIYDGGLMELPAGLIEALKPDCSTAEAEKASAQDATSPEKNSSVSSKTSMLNLALDYAAQGIPVFPCHPSTKAPLSSQKRNGQPWGATKETRMIMDYWGKLLAPSWAPSWAKRLAF